MKNEIIKIIAKITRKFHPKGAESFLRFFYNPSEGGGNYLETVIDYEGGKLQINTSYFLEWVTFFKGHYELEITNLINSRISAESVSVDVGANVGIHSIEMARGRKVYAFEPNPHMLKRLEKNLELSSISNVVCENVGLSDRRRTSKFYLPGKDESNKGIASIFKGHSATLTEEVTIELFTLDEYAKANNFSQLDFIKIDTEGNDFRVILGGAETIKKFRPSILFEYAADD